MLTTEQWILIVRVYSGTNSLKRVKEAFETDFPNTPIPAETTIIKICCYFVHIMLFLFFTNVRHTTLHSTRQHDLRKPNLLHLLTGVRSIHLYRIDMFALFQVCVVDCGIAHLHYFCPTLYYILWI